MRFIFCGLLVLIGFVCRSQMQFRTGDTIACATATMPLVSQNVARSSLGPQSREITRASLRENIFDVRYTGFTAESKAVFEKALEIWSRYLKSQVKVRVLAQWAFNENPNNLGFVIPSEVKDFDGAPLQSVWYPLSLAEKLAGKDLNGTGEIDIIASFNSNRNDWYFGLDGNCPPDKFDLLTIVLHELGHGLGISGTFFKNGAIGSFGISGLPKVYDLYIYNGQGEQLVDQGRFQNGTKELGDQLTNNSLEFNSQIAQVLNTPNGVARIYAPNPFNPGSSISHLDQSYNISVNGLMTPFATPGKVRHEAGPLVKGILYEMGWMNLRMEHAPIGDLEFGRNISFNVAVKSDTVIMNDLVTLRYSSDKFQTFSEVGLIRSSIDSSLFKAEVSIDTSNVLIEYYFVANDVFGRTYRSPGNSDRYSFYLGEDINPPIVRHNQPDYVLPFDETIELSIEATDNIGIKELFLEYRLTSTGDIIRVEGVESTTNQFRVVVDLLSLKIKQGDTIYYRITAVDKSTKFNQTVYPADGFFKLPVRILNPTRIYTDDFSKDNRNFFGDFQITKPTGFSDAAIHSPHPYPIAISSDFVDLTYTLGVPIIVDDQSSFVSFSEVVLIEPGIGEDYKDPLFKDYVIVEGRRVNDSDWKPLTQGYDSRSNNLWLEYYNSKISSGNSMSIGTLNFFVNKKIDLRDLFDPQDTVLMRFRLRSDRTGRGWGWAIDNLVIQDKILASYDFTKESQGFFPNPITDFVWINDSSVSDVVVYSTNGNIVLNSIRDQSGSFNLSSLPSGIYVLRYERGGVPFHERIIKK